jgi:hypothetical protein
MTVPRVTELRRRVESVSRDPFVADLEPADRPSGHVSAALEGAAPTGDG